MMVFSLNSQANHAYLKGKKILHIVKVNTASAYLLSSVNICVTMLVASTPLVTTPHDICLQTKHLLV